MPNPSDPTGSAPSAQRMMHGGAQHPPLILLIDDNAESIRVLSMLIRDMATILFATSGEAGLALARQRHPDLILLDVEMPGIDGYDVCQQLKQDADTQDISVIFVTSHNADRYEVAALEAGAVDFITKPLTPAVVRARVHNHLTLKRQADALQRLAMLDGLTGLYNRVYLNQQLELEWRRHLRQGLSLGFAMVDIDYFKPYNDYYGHLEGDRCLREVAKALAACVRRPGEFVARYGGEEFVLVIPGLNQDELLGWGERLCEQVRALAIPHNRSSCSDVVTISVGISACIPELNQSIDELIDRADHALYQAKQAGRNRTAVILP